MKKIIHIVGARPNFMKAAPAIHAFEAYDSIEQVLVHTGQHYDKNMSDVFFEQLGMPRPDINLEVGSASHAVQTAQVMIKFEEVILEQKPDLVFVYGDVNSTIACALVAVKLGVKVGHVEAGLRSWDRRMPEEINRILTDQCSDYFFTPSTDGDEHLMGEGIAKEKIFFVGNLMIDTLVRLLPQAKKPNVEGVDRIFALVTLHRPSNVDEEAMLRKIIAMLNELSVSMDIVFPVHPRTRARIESLGIEIANNGRFHLVDPLGYLEFLWLQKNAKVVLTDSGGIQEETTYLGIPCLTMRENTERPITCEMGTNQILGQDTEKVKVEVKKILDGEAKKGEIPPLWDGKAGERLAKIAVDLLA